MPEVSFKAPTCYSSFNFSFLLLNYWRLPTCTQPMGSQYIKGVHKGNVFNCWTRPLNAPDWWFRDNKQIFLTSVSFKRCSYLLTGHCIMIILKKITTYLHRPMYLYRSCWLKKFAKTAWKQSLWTSNPMAFFYWPSIKVNQISDIDLCERRSGLS